MKTRILSNVEKQQFNADIAISFDYADVAAATTTVANNALSVLAGTKVQVVGYRQITPFDISGTGALTVSVGDGDSATALMAAIQIAVDDTEITYHIGGSAKVYLVDDTVDIFFTSSAIGFTSGKGVVYLSVQDMNALPVPV